METHDQGPKLGLRCRRNYTEDSVAVKGKRPDFMLFSSRALLFKGEHKASEDELDTALEELSTKLKEWAAVFHGQVHQINVLFCQKHKLCTMSARSDSTGGNTVCANHHVALCSAACGSNICVWQRLTLLLIRCRWSTFYATLVLVHSSKCAPCGQEYQGFTSFVNRCA